MDTKKKSESLKIPSAKNDDQPTTRKMLRLVRDELKFEIRTLERKMDLGFEKVETSFSFVANRFNVVDLRFDEMKTETIRTNILLEEQHANNRIVLEGLQALWQRQERIEKEVANVTRR